MQFLSFDGDIFPSECAADLLDSRALRYNTGLIETMRHHHSIALWKEHLNRLRNSCYALALDTGLLNADEIHQEIINLLQANGVVLSQPVVVRLEIIIASDGRIHRMIELRDIPAPVQPFLIGVSDVVKQADEYAHLKSRDRSVYLAAAAVAAQRRWLDALLVNQYGRIVESTIANVLWQEANKLYSPPLSEGPVAGVYLHQYLAKHTILYTEPLTTGRLQHADKIYLCNAVRGMYEVQLCY